MYPKTLRNIGIINTRTFDNLVAHKFRNFIKLQLIGHLLTVANSCGEAHRRYPRQLDCFVSQQWLLA